MNKIILKGNIGHAPRISLSQDGREIATFSLATSSSWKDKTGEWQTHTDWHRIIVFREATVGWIKDLLQKGDTIYLEGKLTYRNRKDRYNPSRLTPYIVISGSEGKIEHIRSRKPEILPADPSPKEQEGSPFLENNPPNPRSETRSHMPSSQGVPSERASGDSEENSQEENSLRENPPRGSSLQGSPLFTQPIHLEKEKTNEN